MVIEIYKRPTIIHALVQAGAFGLKLQFLYFFLMVALKSERLKQS